MESDGGDPGDVLEQFGVDGESDECEGRKVRRTRLRVRKSEEARPTPPPPRGPRMSVVCPFLAFPHYSPCS